MNMQRWRITIELELECPDTRIGGVPVTESFIRERTEQQFRKMLVPASNSWWVYKRSKISAVAKTEVGERSASTL